ncbi:ANTAR domain-containing protein [Actinomadura gamaensis]|uniref:ANTAR domain-containing protein n=1 Tax=Actinomadura gamaensis TaxID=1763541 RepID=A0ABV9U188_9ACTN
MNSILKEHRRAEAFRVSDAPLLVIDTDVVIRDVNPAYLKATSRSYEELVGTPLFEAFPDNPDDPRADGVATLSASFERVFREGGRDQLPLQRYDIPAGDILTSGTRKEFVPRVWLPVTTALRDEAGRVVGALHHAEDVTAITRAVQDLGTPSSTDLSRDQRAWTALVLALARETHGHQQARMTVAQLQHALDSRIVIEQAKGVVAAREGIGIDAAFDRLRRYSRNHCRRLHEVARAVVEDGLTV